MPNKVTIPVSLKSKFDEALLGSITFKETVDKVLTYGDITYHLVDDDKSFYDGRQRAIVLGVRTFTAGDKMSLSDRTESDMIFEFMNAYMEDTAPAPAITSYSSAEEYGKAKEYHEWAAVKRHYTVMKELQITNAKWAALNRFALGFETTNATESWNAFDGYYARQLSSGHTTLYHNDYKKAKLRAPAITGALPAAASSSSSPTTTTATATATTLAVSSTGASI